MPIEGLLCVIYDCSVKDQVQCFCFLYGVFIWKKYMGRHCSSTFFCLSSTSLPIEFCCPSSVCPQVLCVDVWYYWKLSAENYLK